MLAADREDSALMFAEPLRSSRASRSLNKNGKSVVGDLPGGWKLTDP